MDFMQSRTFLLLNSANKCIRLHWEDTLKSKASLVWDHQKKCGLTMDIPFKTLHHNNSLVSFSFPTLSSNLFSLRKMTHSSSPKGWEIFSSWKKTGERTHEFGSLLKNACPVFCFFFPNSSSATKGSSTLPQPRHRHQRRMQGMRHAPNGLVTSSTRLRSWEKKPKDVLS